MTFKFRSIFTLLCVLFMYSQTFAQLPPGKNPGGKSWADSFQANGLCWCDSTFDHNLDNIRVAWFTINGVRRNIRDICDELKNHPQVRNYREGDPIYNDIQCGNGPPNDADDETQCPGRVDKGRSGCTETGPRWDVEWLKTRERFGGNGDDGGSTGGGNGTVVQMRKRNSSGFAIDGNGGGANRQNVYIWSQNRNNVNQQWIEIDRGNGYYSYQKMGTNYCIDGNRGGANGQNVYLWSCSSGNQNQHWRKVNMGSGNYRLEKRNASGFSLDGGRGGANGQNLYLWTSMDWNQNQHWSFTSIGSAKSIGASAISEFINVYPNPFVDTFSVDVLELESAKVSMHNATGKLIFEETVEGGLSNFNLNNVPSGLYLVRIEAGNELLVKKLIKN